MKKVIILLVLCILSTAVVSAAQQKQTATSTQKVEKVVDPSKDTNPKIGTIKMTKDSVVYQVYQGPRGGKYIWWKVTRGEDAGKMKHRSLTKKEQQRIRYNKK